MNIIIEGPDCSGKTTLANYLKEHYFLDYRHSSSKTENDFKYHFDLLNSSNLVLDRFHLGEFIFPALVDRKAKMSFEDLKQLTNLIEYSNDCILVILYASDVNLLKRRLTLRGDDEFTVNNIESINYMFKMFAVSMFQHHKRIIGIDVCKQHPSKVVDEYLKGATNGTL